MGALIIGGIILCALIGIFGQSKDTGPGQQWEEGPRQARKK